MTYHYDEAAAQMAVDFIGCLKHSKGQHAGKPFILQPWQEKIIRTLFGWKREDGTRRYRKLLLEIPRGNGKTALAAAIALVLLFIDNQAKPEIYVAAADREQASICYTAAWDFITSSPDLLAITNPTASRKMLENTINGGVMKALSSDGSTKHGSSPSVVVFDEAHCYLKPGAMELVDALQTGLGKRDNSLQIIISTAGFNRYSWFAKELDYARKVIAGTIVNDSYLAYIFEAADTDPIDDPATWMKANPNYGVTVSESFLRDEATKALQDPEYISKFKRLYLNIWTATEVKWLLTKTWEESAGTVDLESLKGRSCYAGLDLSSKEDITALVLVFPVDDIFKVVPFFFIPGDNMRQRSVTDGVSYDVWAQAGHVIVTPGNVIDYDAVYAKLVELKTLYDIKECAFDRWGAPAISQKLTEDGFTMVPFGQGFVSMSEPTKELKRQIMLKKIHHGNNPVLSWMADCVTVEQKQGDLIKMVKPDRRKSRNRIDGMIALLMGTTRALLASRKSAADSLIGAYL